MNRQRILAQTLIFLFSISIPAFILASGMRGQPDMLFPLPLNAYQDNDFGSTTEILLHRILVDPMNLVVSLMFLCAIIHTFCVGTFRRLAEKTEATHRVLHKIKKQEMKYNGNVVNNVSFKAELFYLLGEVEIIFALWVMPVFWSVFIHKGWDTILHYMTTVNFTEPMFVVVIMAMASSRPIERFSEYSMRFMAQIGKGSTAAWWFIILTVGPILGSFITEPGAMTISAMLLGKQFYKKKPSLTFAYATIGLLFVNISVGGTFSNFAAPPVLMVAGPWNWDFSFMIFNFGWKALVGILVSNSLYFVIFRSEFKRLDKYNTLEIHTDGEIDWEDRDEPIPASITVVHILIMVWTVFSSHYPVLFIPGFFVFLGFRRATAHHQNDTNLKPPILVGAFLAGLVVHGGLQAWWIAPILGNLPELTLMLGATLLTAFNDNAAIAYLSTLVPTLTESMKYAVIAGAVTGGGLTVIANAPNPAGVSILREYFEYGVSPVKLLLGALIPTVILGCAFMLLP
jgi:Putative Na+/H+ antiporter